MEFLPRKEGIEMDPAFVLSNGCPKTGVGLSDNEQKLVMLRETLQRQLEGGFCLFVKDNLTNLSDKQAVDPTTLSWFSAEALENGVRICELQIEAPSADGAVDFMVNRYAELRTDCMPALPGQKAIAFELRGPLNAIIRGKLKLRRRGDMLDIIINPDSATSDHVAYRLPRATWPHINVVACKCEKSLPGGCQDLIWNEQRQEFLAPEGLPDVEIFADDCWDWSPEATIDHEVVLELKKGSPPQVIATGLVAKNNKPTAPFGDYGQVSVTDTLLQHLESVSQLLSQTRPAIPQFELLYGFTTKNLIRGLQSAAITMASLWPDIVQEIKNAGRLATPVAYVEGQITAIQRSKTCVTITVDNGEKKTVVRYLPTLQPTVSIGQQVSKKDAIGKYGPVIENDHAAMRAYDPQAIRRLATAFVVNRAVTSNGLAYAPSTYCYSLLQYAAKTNGRFSVRLPSWAFSGVKSDGKITVFPVCPGRLLSPGQTVSLGDLVLSNASQIRVGKRLAAARAAYSKRRRKINEKR